MRDIPEHHLFFQATVKVASPTIPMNGSLAGTYPQLNRWQFSMTRALEAAWVGSAGLRPVYVIGVLHDDISQAP